MNQQLPERDENTAGNLTIKERAPCLIYPVHVANMY